MEQINYSNCPSCGSADISFQLSAKDYTVSGEEFPIWACRVCSLRFTQQVPSQAAIGRYYKAENYISHTDTRAGFINTLYHRIRKRTLQSKEQLLKKYTGLSAGRLLDIGAGTGAFCRHMKEAGWHVTGLEPDEATRQRAQELHGLALLPAGELFRLPAQSYDAVTLWHVLEHVHALHEYLEQIRNVITPGARIFIAVPNYTSYDAEVYRQYWAAYDVPRHLYHFSPQAMEHLLKKKGLTLEATEPMWYDSFYVSMLSERYKNGKAGYAKAVGVGFLSNWKALFNRRRCSSVIYVIKS
ncbi:MAG: class I SAM-dependent methyltransferase [Williamsia sp.]|nr:class I SAM-dependent methyltransferase [Williamsia sp.]